ncbi:MAG: ligase-associated DNA damage response exonuclease [Boseongicola sp.]|nr:MAG: ligase-associated DNA damage response exonuclease [Boseongicola sp.]
MACDPVLTFTKSGIYCPAGDFFIDPTRRVDRALITHGHADHGRRGMGRYLMTGAAAPVMRHRLGDVPIETVAFGEPRQIGGARVSFHPAGHVPGSAQIRVEVAGEVWVVSGDYKVVDDGVSEAFQPVGCHTFITECTFGLPVFHWDPPAQVTREINDWWSGNARAGRFSICGAYSLGKAQRILAGLDLGIGPVLVHGAIEDTNEVLRAQGVSLPRVVRMTEDLDPRAYPGAFVLAPPGSMTGQWAARFHPSETAFASGWMAMRKMRGRGDAQRGFVMSDHADWAGLNRAIAETGAERVFVMHGYTGPFRRWLEEQGYDAGDVADGN